MDLIEDVLVLKVTLPEQIVVVGVWVILGRHVGGPFCGIWVGD